MTNEYRYMLETPRVTGRHQQKFRCPNCGRKSFVRYVDTHNNCGYVADEFRQKINPKVFWSISTTMPG